MPKMKTKRAAAKRFKATGSGLKRGKAYHRHLLGYKRPKRKRNLRQSKLVDKANLKGIKRLLPYA